MFFPDFQPMRVSEKPVCIYLFRHNTVFTSLRMRSPVRVVPLQGMGCGKKIGASELKVHKREKYFGSDFEFFTIL